MVGNEGVGRCVWDCHFEDVEGELPARGEGGRLGKGVEEWGWGDGRMKSVAMARMTGLVAGDTTAWYTWYGNGSMARCSLDRRELEFEQLLRSIYLSARIAICLQHMQPCRPQERYSSKTSLGQKLGVLADSFWIDTMISQYYGVVSQARSATESYSMS